MMNHPRGCCTENVPRASLKSSPRSPSGDHEIASSSRAHRRNQDSGLNRRNMSRDTFYQEHYLPKEDSFCFENDRILIIPGSRDTFSGHGDVERSLCYRAEHTALTKIVFSTGKTFAGIQLWPELCRDRVRCMLRYIVYG